MTMAESEARKKWCPFSNVNIPYANTGAGGNRGHFSDVGQFQERYTRCITTSCMMWVDTPPTYKSNRPFFTVDELTFPTSLVHDEIEKRKRELQAEGYEPRADSEHFFGVAKLWGKDRVEQGRCGLVKP